MKTRPVCIEAVYSTAVFEGQSTDFYIRLWGRFIATLRSSAIIRPRFAGHKKVLISILPIIKLSSTRQQ
jgi:hypothetical protein